MWLSALETNWGQRKHSGWGITALHTQIKGFVPPNLPHWPTKHLLTSVFSAYYLYKGRSEGQCCDLPWTSLCCPFSWFDYVKTLVKRCEKSEFHQEYHAGSAFSSSIIKITLLQSHSYCTLHFQIAMRRKFSTWTRRCSFSCLQHRANDMHEIRTDSMLASRQENPQLNSKVIIFIHNI